MVAEEPKAPLTQPFLHSRRQLLSDWTRRQTARRLPACLPCDWSIRKAGKFRLNRSATNHNKVPHEPHIVLGSWVQICSSLVVMLLAVFIITSSKKRGKKIQIKFGSKKLWEPKIILRVIKCCLCVEFIPSLSLYFCPNFIIILEMFKKHWKNRILSEVNVDPWSINPLNAELNPICYLLALLGAHHFLHISRIRVKLLSFRLLMSYIYIWSTHSWCF